MVRLTDIESQTSHAPFNDTSLQHRISRHANLHGACMSYDCVFGQNWLYETQAIVYNAESGLEMTFLPCKSLAKWSYRYKS